MNADQTLIAHRLPLPCQVPPGGRAIVLVDGRVAPGGVQGPGPLDPKDWRQHGRDLEAVLIPATTLRLRFDVSGLHTAEGINLDLTVTLLARIVQPAKFLTDVVRDAHEFAVADLVTLLQDAVRTGLEDDFRRRSLPELEADANLRGWLGTAVEGYLTTEADLLGRSGLAVVGVNAFDLRCRLWDEQRQASETLYLRAALAQTEAEGRKLLDQGVLTELRQHLPVKEELVEHKERLAALTEREGEADARLDRARRQRRVQLQNWAAAQQSRPSSLRPELWRQDLGEEVHTAPLGDGCRVFVVAGSGRAFAFDAEGGAPIWPQLVELGTSPGDGLALAGGYLWVPAHDGVLYGLDPANGTVVHRVEVGGRLSSAPLVGKDHLYLSVDVDARTLRPGAGDVVVVDPCQGIVAQRWKVSGRGLRAQPAIWERTLYVGDRGGGFYALDLRRGAVEKLPLRGGRILASPLVDPGSGQVIAADSYGRLVALDRSGRQRWATRLEGAVVGCPLLHGDLLYAGAGDGRVYVLDPRSGQPASDPFQTRDAVAASPVAWHDLVFVSSNDGYLYALEEGGQCAFWQYHSGSPVSVPIAVTPQGRLYVVDGEGHVNALRWCLARYPEGARRALAAEPPRVEEAIELWLLAGETRAALETAEGMRRPDLVAELALSLNWYEHAARSFEELARRSRDPLRAATYWAEAAQAWQLEGQTERADQCRLSDARARNAPLLKLREANLPQLILGQPDVVQVCLTNLTDQVACNLILAYEGHVQQAGERRLGSLGPHSERLEEIEVVPTESGSAVLRIKVHYEDLDGRPQRPVPLDVRLRVAQPPEVHHHYYGPVVGRDGMIIMRGGGESGGRRIRVESGDDAIEIVRSTGCTEPAERICPACGDTVAPGHRFCSRCGQEVTQD